MKPGVYDTEIFRGTIWEYVFTWRHGDTTVYNLTGYTGSAVFTGMGGASPVTIAADMAGAANGAIHVKMEEEMTEAVVWESGTWHLQVNEPDGDPIRLLIGHVKVRA